MQEETPPTVAPEGSAPVAPPKAPRACVFDLAGASYAVPVAAVREVAMLTQLSPVPRAPVHVRGVANLRGVLLPVVDPAVALGHDGGPIRPVTATVVIRDGAEEVGLAVDGVAGLLPIESFVPLSATERLGPARFTEGVFQAGERPVRLLDPAALLEALRPRSPHPHEII